MTGGAVTLRRPGLSRDINGPGGGGISVLGGYVRT